MADDLPDGIAMLLLSRAAPVLFLLAAAIPVHAAGAASSQKEPVDLTLLTLEELMSIEVVSASHKEQRLADTAAAVHVITSEDIRRSGLTTIPELLRLAPGVQVARINSNKWAVAIRGFNNLFTDKLLVLVDGRTMYDRLNSGVFWESIDVPTELVDRIEVIRGPGGAIWGANAVNGVINIVTKSAADTTGATLLLRGGSLTGGEGSAGYGWEAGDAAFRVHTQWSNKRESRLADGSNADDAWESQTHSARMDWERGRDHVMAQGGATLASLRGLWPEQHGPVPAASDAHDPVTETRELFALARWTRRLDARTSFELQTFLNHRRNLDDVNPRQILADIGALYRTRIGRHDLAAGGGYRIVDERTTGSFAFAIDPANVREAVVNAFAQDEISLGTRVKVTLGAKVERDTYAGWGLQPTARVMWAIVPRRQHLWASVSRALRTPSLGDVSGRYHYTSFMGPTGMPVVVGALGNPEYEPEDVVDGDVGYRLELGGHVSVDVTAFRAAYDRLKTSEPLAPRVQFSPPPMHLFVPSQFANLLEANTDGVELSARWTPSAWSRIEGGYSTFRVDPRLSSISRDAAAATFDGNAPRHQWQLRSAFSLTPRVQLDGLLFYTGAIASIPVQGYTRADVHASISLSKQFTLGVSGQNLFDRRHAEFGGRAAIVMPTEIPRSFFVELGWRR